MKDRDPSGKRPSYALLAALASATLPLIAAAPAPHRIEAVRRPARPVRPKPLEPSYIVVDTARDPGGTPEILGQQQDLQRRPASLTKLMTAYLLCSTLTEDAGKPKADRVFPDGLATQIPITRTAAATSGSRLGLRAGTTVDLRTLAMGMMTISANDAATAIGEAIAGPSRNAADLMNAEANRLGMYSSGFIDATGQDILLPDKPRQNLSTARDIATLAASLYRDYQGRFPDILHPAQVRFGNRQMENIEKDVLGSPQGSLGRVVLAKGGINVGGHDSAMVLDNGDRTRVMVILGAVDADSMKRLRASLLQEARRMVPAPAPPLPLSRPHLPADPPRGPGP